MNRTKVAILITFLTAGTAFAALKTWSNGEVIRATDLNSNFSQTNTFNAAAPVTNAKVAANAAIAHSKLATPALIPKGAAYVNNGGCGAPCDLTFDFQAGDVVATAGVSQHTAAGTYIIDISPNVPDDQYLVQLTTTDPNVACAVTFRGVATFVVGCTNNASVATNTNFFITRMDN